MFQISKNLKCWSSDFGSEGRRFESCRVRHYFQQLTSTLTSSKYVHCRPIADEREKLRPFHSQDIIKIGNGSVSRQEMLRKEVNLSSMAETITDELSESQPERQVTFVIKAEVMVNGDVNLLRIAIENLLENAWKYTSKHPKAKIEFGVTEQDGKKAYFVRDDGTGFDNKYVGKLFGPFQRLHKSDEFEGNGIGLATVQRIINRHGGRVWAEGAVEKGATFFFTLP